MFHFLTSVDRTDFAARNWQWSRAPLPFLWPPSLLLPQMTSAPVQRPPPVSAPVARVFSVQPSAVPWASGRTSSWCFEPPPGANGIDPLLGSTGCRWLSRRGSSVESDSVALCPARKKTSGSWATWKKSLCLTFCSLWLKRKVRSNCQGNGSRTPSVNGHWR